MLLIHTGWNGDTLLNLEAGEITQVENLIVLRSFKSKSDQATPEVHLDAKYPGLQAAIDLFVWNNLQLKRLGWIGENDGGGWYSWPARTGAVERRPIFFLAHKRFIARHGIPHFSTDQIRTHMLVRMAISGGSIEAARTLAGHSSIRTTGHYLDQFIVQALSRATNLEFQRRFGLIASEPNLKATDLKSLNRIAVGDGTSCRSPAEPPNSDWLENGVCNGKNCHELGGCENNFVEVTKERVEEVWRWHVFYSSHWQRLYSENPEAFERFHGPAFLFNIAFLDFLRESTFSSEVAAIIQAIGGEPGHA